MQNFSSILIFEINKKFLLNKIITDELYEFLRTEIIKNFGVKYVEEKSNLNDLESGSSPVSSSTSQTHLSVTDDLIYEYFSPIINSYEISKEINYTSEYALFTNSDYLIRFYPNKIFLILTIFNSKTYISHQTSGTLTKQIYSEFYSNWYSKSFISLVKYKFGICQDERCFKELYKTEINNLMKKWYINFNTDQVCFTESIEKLDINEDIKIKCEQFLNDLIDFLFKTETLMSEFDYMNDNYDELGTNLDDYYNEDFIYDEGKQYFNSQKSKFTEVEYFFQDLTQIDQFILTYGNKLLFKKGNDNNSVDSSSLFMLLLEAGIFLDCNQINEDDNDCFQSIKDSNSSQDDQESIISLTPDKPNKLFLKSTPKNIEPISQFNNFFKEPPSPNEFNFLNDKNNNNSNNDNNDNNHDNNNNYMNDKINNKKLTKFKKTNCFLKRVNKTLGSYEVIFLKLSDFLCLIMLKPNKLNKYCELISDFDNLIDELIELLNRKRSFLSLHDNSVKENTEMNTSRLLVNRKMSENNDKSIDKNFFSFFMNKLIIFYEKLGILKNDLTSKNFNSSKKFDKSNFFSRAFKSQSYLNSDQDNTYNSNNNNSNLRTPSSKGEPSFQSLNEQEISKNCANLIQQLQNKLNKFTKSKHFNEFAAYINNGLDLDNLESDIAIHDTSSKKQINDLLTNLRLIETQINAIRTNCTEIFYELFLSKATIITDTFEKLIGGRSSSKQRSNSSNTNSNEALSLSRSSVLFKSTHLIDNIQVLFRKHIYDYTVYMDLKWRHNIAMSYYCHQFPGLVHFSFINRQDNICCIPTIDPLLKYNITEEKIKFAYRKYIPILNSFLYKFDCTQFKFNDDKLEIVFSYFIWFEDKKSNYLPVDFNLVNKNFNNEYLMANKIGVDLNDRLLTLQTERRQTQPPGITDKNYYELLKNLCYPNAPIDSLICYELFCIHSTKVDDETIKSQLNLLVDSISKMTKN